jgi:hypothetical protein
VLFFLLECISPLPSPPLTLTCIIALFPHALYSVPNVSNGKKRGCRPTIRVFNTRNYPASLVAQFSSSEFLFSDEGARTWGFRDIVIDADTMVGNNV